MAIKFGKYKKEQTSPSSSSLTFLPSPTTTKTSIHSKTSPLPPVLETLSQSPSIVEVNEIKPQPPILIRRNTLTQAESEEFASAIVKTNIPISPQGTNTNKDIKEQVNLQIKHVIGPNDFDLLCVIGVGAFGKVLQVRYKPTQEILAMKIICNKYIVKHKAEPYLQAERDIMTKIRHPFLINLRYAFQTTEKVYLVMPFVSGGELFHHLNKQGLLLEDTARFYAAEMVLALEHLHNKGIIHRDLKPENILLGSDGHIRLTDFGLAKEMDIKDEEYTTKTMCGTEEYMAPEMVRRKPYNQAVDWWALGALIYEMVTGRPPFRHKNKKKLHEKILQEKLNLPKWLQPETHSILKQLLERNVEKRLGSGKSTMFKMKGVQAIKSHAFFRDIDWNALELKLVTPPILLNVASTTDTSYFAEEFTKLNISDEVATGKVLKLNNENEFPALVKSPSDLMLEKLFKRFSFNADDEENTVPDPHIVSYATVVSGNSDV